MRKHPHAGPHAPKPRSRSHPVTLAIGLVLVVAVVTAVVLTVRFLYSDYAWHTAARDSSAAVARAIADLAEIDEATPTPVDAVSGRPAAGQVPIAQLPYASDVPTDVTRLRLTPGGALSVLTSSGALCSGVTFDMTDAGKSPSGSFACAENIPPTVPLGLVATPRDASVILEWQHPPEPVEDYAVTYSPDDGATWLPADDGVSSQSQAEVRSLLNGHRYLFRVAAMNLAGTSATASASASPFTRPAPPTNVQATGGFTTIVSWTPSEQDGGSPITAYVVEGVPTGRCVAAPPATSCEVKDLPAAPAYTFTVRAVNAAGAGAPSLSTGDPVAVFSVPGRPVALTASPGNGVIMLAWTDPLLDGNTPIVDYRVEYKRTVDREWTEYGHPPSPQTSIAIGGLTNGTSYDFRVMAVNAAGTSDPPLSNVSQTPATVPDAVESLLEADSDASVMLTWSAPAFDGGAPVTDYVVQYSTDGALWAVFDDDVSTDPQGTVTGLDNGTAYSFRVAAVNEMGTGPWSVEASGNPFTLPGPVTEPVAVGSPTSVELSWRPPADDGGRPITHYRVQYKLSAAPDWLLVQRVPASTTTVIVPGLVKGESYDFRIAAISSAGVGQSSVEGYDSPTLAAVVVDETPPAPTGVRAVPGDRQVTLSWRASPAGPDSPIVSYTVTGTPSGTCTTAALTCVVRGLSNGVVYSFTVSAANANIKGPESAPVVGRPQTYNSATGGVESTYTRGGRTYRVHTFSASAPFVVTAGSRPFDVLVVGGGGGSVVGADGVVSVGDGGQVLAVRQSQLTSGTWSVVVGDGGAPGAAGVPSTLGGVATAGGGVPGPPAPAPMQAARSAIISGTPTLYGGPGTPTSGQGVDGRGTGGGGPGANRGGNGIVIIRYEIAP